MPKVSFVLPAYKGRFLREAIASILAQTCRAFELIVVDDASPEDLRAIAASFDDPRLTYRRNGRNLGGADLVAAWRTALSYATGEWVVLASDDDVYDPRYLETMLDLVARHPAVDLAHPRVRLIDAAGRICGLSPFKPEVESAIELLHARVVGGASQFVPEFMFRRARMEEIGGFVNFPKAWYSDEATWTLMAANGCANSPETLFSFRCSGLNISTSYDKVFDLVEAGVRYLAWARSWVRAFSPRNDEERFLRDDVDAHLALRVRNLMFGELDATSFRERIRVLRKGTMPRAWKRRYVLHALKNAIR